MADSDSDTHGGVTGVLLEHISTLGNQILTPVLTSCPMLVVGFLCMLHYNIVPFFGYTRSTVIRIFGQGVLVLQFYCDPEIKCENPFVMSGLLIVLDQIIIFGVVDFVGHRLGNRQHTICGIKWLTYSQKRRQKVLDEEIEDDEGVVRSVQSKYQDFSYPFRQASLVFFGQAGLICYFVYSLNADKSSHDVANVNMVKWLVAVVLTMCVDEDEAGGSYTSTFWSKEVPAHDEAKKLLDLPRHTVMYCIPITFYAEWMIRRIFDLLVNGVGRTLIMATAPMLLSTEEPMDFIKDCLALFFITKLDDWDDAKSLTEVLEATSKIYKKHVQLREWQKIVHSNVQTVGEDNYLTAP